MGYVLETAGAITGISQASPGVVTDVAHGFSNGDHIWLDGIVGMNEFNRRRVTITVLSAEIRARWLRTMMGGKAFMPGFSRARRGGKHDGTCKQHSTSPMRRPEY